MGLWQVFTGSSLAFHQIGNRVQPQTVDAQIQPEFHHIPDGFYNGGIVKIQVGLVTEKSVPVIRLIDGIPGPIRQLRVEKDDLDALITRVCLAPHVPVAFRVLSGVAASAFGLLTLLFGVSGVLLELRDALNTIW